MCVSCKDYESCKDTFRRYSSYKCTCREDYGGDKCATHKGIIYLSHCFVIDFHLNYFAKSHAMFFLSFVIKRETRNAKF